MQAATHDLDNSVVNHNLPPRPRWNFPEVKTEATKEILEDVHQWALARDVPESKGELKQFRALVTLAALESPDAYWATNYLQNIYDWPADHELLKIMEQAYFRMPRLVTPFLHAWVMKNSVRLVPVEKDRIKFRVGTVEMVGTVVACIPREARMIVTVGVKKPVNMSVPAEEFVEVLAKSTNIPPQADKRA